MSGMMDQPEHECIDPSLGDELWRLADEATGEALRARLETHVTFCASCRERQSLESILESGLLSGDLRLRGSEDPSQPRNLWLGGFGGLAMAAGLALMFVLPPSPPSNSVVRSDEDLAGIERPVAGEVVLTPNPTLRWSAIEGATAYRVTVSAVGSEYAWQARVAETSVRIPEESALPREARLRVIVEAVPAHLTPAGGMDTTFRTGNVGAFLLHRVRAGSTTGRGAVALGLGTLVVAGILAARRRTHL